MPIIREKLDEILTQRFPDCELQLVDMAGDNDHWQVGIKASELSGKSRIEQHRIVMDCLIPYNIHAVSIKVLK